MTNHEDLPPFLLAFPGPLRDQLVAAVLSGAKTSTTGLVAEYEAVGEALPLVGERQVVLDSDELPVAVIEVTDVRVLRAGDVDDAHARDEGEGYTTVAEWRRVHEGFWHSPEVRAEIGDPDFTVDDDTLVVAERFRVVEVLPR
ncbi:ASCH domain-containing protein [Streptomyces sp. NRRL S-87]|uniref:ASCH domain-containing protein n=1 Tax=Streptomyces sp. NRRL S-87 TaxID=1463920 RepID=UPI0004C0EC58|nr:ASCH domain-containing protein [Streptomyces sp. NRRL S-87]